MSVPSILKNDPKTRDALAAQITNMLKSGEDVSISGVGKISVSRREARTGRNPATGAPVQIAAKTVPKFTPAKALKDALNG